MTYWTIEPEWAGETCYLVCGGPSLIGFDFTRLKGKRVVAINSSFYAVPFADMLVFSDGRWWQSNRHAALKFAGTIVCLAEEIKEPPLKRMRREKPPGLTMKRDSAVMRRTTLTCALNILMHRGVSKIVLMGADMKADTKGRTHHHAPHEWPTKAGCWEEQMKDLRTTAKPLLQANIEVINTSLESLIDWWPKQAIGELL